MTDPDLPTEPPDDDPEAPTAEGAGAEPSQPQLLDLPEFKAEDHARWRSSSRGCYGIGCLGGLIALAMVLWLGYFTLQQSVWVTYKKSSERLVKAMTFEIDPGRRQRFEETLPRYTARLKALPEPYPAIGRFNQEVNRVLSDNRLSLRELEGIEAIIADELAKPDPAVERP